MAKIGYPLELVENPSDLNVIQKLDETNHFLAILITSVGRNPKGERNPYFTAREIKHLARICVILGLEKTITSMKGFDDVDLFWNMIEEARKMGNELHWSGYPSAVYSVCYFYNRLRLTGVFSEEFIEDDHSPYYMLGKERLLELLARQETNHDTYFSLCSHPGYRRPVCIMTYKSSYLRDRVIKTLRVHRICDDNDGVNVSVVEGFEGWFNDPDNIHGYKDFTSARLSEACAHIDKTWPDDVKAREYRYKFLFDIWSDIIMDYPKHNFFEDSYLYNTELILNGFTALNLARGYKLVVVGLNEEIPPYGLIQFVVARDELRSASGRRYCQRSFDTTMIKDLRWRKAVINYAAYCITNGNRQYVHVITPLLQLLQHKQETFSKDRYNVSGEELYWMKMQLYHRSNIVTATKSTIFNGIKTFLRYADRMGYVTVEKRDLKRIKSISTKYIPNSHSLSMQEITAIDEAFDTLASKSLHYRYSKIIFHIQLNSEARIGEICSILLDTLTFHEDGTCSIYEKVKNNGRDMMLREYNTLATGLIREAMEISRDIRQTCPVGGPRESIFLYTNDNHNVNHFSIMDVIRYNGDLSEACKVANVSHFSSGNVRDTTMTARKRLARKVGLTDMETGAFVGHVEKVSTNSYEDMDFRDVLQATRGFNIGTKK